MVLQVKRIESNNDAQIAEINKFLKELGDRCLDIKFNDGDGWAICYITFKVE